MYTFSGPTSEPPLSVAVVGSAVVCWATEIAAPQVVEPLLLAVSLYSDAVADHAETFIYQEEQLLSSSGGPEGAPEGIDPLQQEVSRIFRRDDGDWTQVTLSGRN